MIRTAPSHDPSGAKGTVVQAPHRTDAVAGSLRHAYAAEGILPRDIAEALSKLANVAP